MCAGLCVPLHVLHATGKSYGAYKDLIGCWEVNEFTLYLDKWAVFRIYYDVKQAFSLTIGV